MYISFKSLHGPDLAILHAVLQFLAQSTLAFCDIGVVVSSFVKDSRPLIFWWYWVVLTYGTFHTQINARNKNDAHLFLRYLHVYPWTANMELLVNLMHYP